MKNNQPKLVCPKCHINHCEHCKCEKCWDKKTKQPGRTTTHAVGARSLRTSQVESNHKTLEWEEELNSKLDTIVRRLLVLGYNAGKQQQKTPYEYTLDTYELGLDSFKDLKSLFSLQKQKYIQMGEVMKYKYKYFEKVKHLPEEVDHAYGYNQAISDYQKEMEESEK